MLTNRLGMAIARFRRPALAPDGPDFSTAQIGDEVGGGIYAGTITYADARQFHIVAPKEADGLSPAVKWGYYNSVTGCDDPDDGMANQGVMLARLDGGDDYGSHPPEAFIHARDYVDSEGNGSYYFPAKNELNLVWQNLYAANHPDFPGNTQYDRLWSSTEVDSTFAWIQVISTGVQRDDYGWKDTPNYHALPIRRIPV